MTVRILVSGTRHMRTNANITAGIISGAISKTLKELGYDKRRKKDDPIVVIHGNARGVDQTMNPCMWLKYYSFEVYPADWKKYGKAAGPIRNQQMLDEGKPDLVVAIPYKGKSKGTYDMIDRAVEANLPVGVLTVYQPHEGGDHHIYSYKLHKRNTWPLIF